MSTPVVITGCNGQLGKSLQKIAEDYHEIDFHFLESSECDITDRNQVQQAITRLNPEYLINAAAYTAVDKAETEIDDAFAVNAYALQNIGQCMGSKKVLHISTDYVYHQPGPDPLRENTILNPQSQYAKSKAAGEKILMTTSAQSMIIRTSWVYSEFGNNFVKTMLRLSDSNTEIKVVNDQWGSPTYATDLARVLLEIISKDMRLEISNKSWNQVYNYCNKGRITWFDLASQVMELARKDTIIKPIPTAMFPTQAPRPPWSVLDMEKIKSKLNVELTDWKVSLEKCIGYLIN